MPRYKLESITTSIEDAICHFYEDCEPLRDECQEVVDNTPESLQSSPRIQPITSPAQRTSPVASTTRCSGAESRSRSVRSGSRWRR